jgi:hypothetical protein
MRIISYTNSVIVIYLTYAGSEIFRVSSKTAGTAANLLFYLFIYLFINYLEAR